MLFVFAHETNIKLQDIKNTTLRVICRLFCTNQSEVPLQFGYLAHMIRILSAELSSGITSSVSVIIKSTKYIFSLDYRGLLVLIPSYLKTIQEILKPKSEYEENIKSAAITILGSLICLPDQYSEYVIPSIVKGTEKMTMEEVKNQVQEMVWLFIKEWNAQESPAKAGETKSGAKIIGKVICCANVIIYQEAAKVKPESDIIKKYVMTILETLSESSSIVSELILSCLSSLACIFPILYKCDRQIIESTFNSLSENLSRITDKVSNVSPDGELYVRSLLTTILELVLEDRYNILTGLPKLFFNILDNSQKLTHCASAEIRNDALMVIEFIKEFYMNYPLRGQSPAIICSLFDETDFYYLQNEEFKKSHRELVSQKAAEAIEVSPKKEDSLEESEGDRLFEMLKRSSIEVKNYLSPETAQADAPVPKQPEASSLKDQEDYKFWKGKAINLAYGSNIIITIIQAPYLTSKIIVRNLTGIHAWILTEHRVLGYDCLKSIDYNDKAAVYKNILTLKEKSKLKEVVTEAKTASASLKEEEEELVQGLKEALKFDPVEENKKIDEDLKNIQENDTLMKIITLLSKHYPDMAILEGLIKNMEINELAQNEKEIAEYQVKTCNLEKAEQILSRLSEAERKAKLEDDFKTEMQMLDVQYESNEQRFDQSWAFLRHTSSLDLLSTAPSKLTLLNDNDTDFRMLLKFLDTECALRMSIKVGVIYVDRDQFNQKDILFNTKGSEKYEELLGNLGKYVHKSELHKSLSLQPNILYYATATYELVFHVITKMATNFNDVQQLEKKKYVGNDSVHIIWSENDRDYRPGTITGAFNFVHLIIHPLRNGLYKLRIEKKRDKNIQLVKFFGPLLSGMVLPMNILSALLRYTTINARKSITYKNLQLFNPLSERKKTLEKIINKFAFKPATKSDEESALIDAFVRSCGRENA